MSGWLDLKDPKLIIVLMTGFDLKDLIEIGLKLLKALGIDSDLKMYRALV